MIKTALTLIAVTRLRLSQQLLAIRFCTQKQPSVIQLTSKIIRKITDPPIIAELEKQALRDQILAFVNKSNNEKWKEQIKQMYETGIERNQIVHNQQRFEQGQTFNLQKQIQKKLIFEPFHLAGSQIFDQINNFEKRTTLLYGHFGIAKSFRFYQYQYLQNIILQDLISMNQQKITDPEQKQKIKKQRMHKIQEMFQKYRLLPIKLIYWNIQREADISDEHLIKMFSSQCTEISQEQLKKYGQKFGSFVQKINNFYNQRGVQTCLIVDQINIVFSVYRQKFLQQQLQFQKQLPDQIKKQIQVRQSAKKQIDDQYNRLIIVNQKRRRAQNFFNKTIFNSSVNIQALYQRLSYKSNNMNIHKLNNIIQNIQTRVLKSLVDRIQLTKHWYHQKNYKKKRIKYPQLLLQDSSGWELADFVVFELEKDINIKQNLGRKVGIQVQGQNIKVTLKQYLRKLIHQRIQQILKRTIITPLDIRNQFQKKLNQQKIFSSQFNLSTKFIQQLLKQLNNLQQLSLKMQVQSLDKFGSKMPDIKWKNQILQKIYIHVSDLVRKKQEKLDQNLPNASYQKQVQNQQLNFEQRMKNKVKIQLNKMLYFFKNQQNQIDINHFSQYFDRLDQNMFISFKNFQTFQGYLIQVLKNIFQEFIVNQQDPGAKQILRNLQRQSLIDFTSKVKNKKFPIMFVLTSSQRLIYSLDSQIRHLISFQTDYFKKIFINKSVSGQLIESYMLRALQKEKNRIKIGSKEFQFKNTVQVKQFKSFPKTKKQAKSVIKKQQKIKKLLFFNQFLDNINAYSSVFLPQNNFTIAMDFVIRLIDGNILQLNYYDVTVAKDPYTIEGKITNFLQCLQYYDQKEHSAINPETSSKLQIKNNYFIIASPKNLQKFKPIEKSFRVMKKLAQMNQTNFVLSKQIENFLSQLHEHYKKQKKQQDIKQINKEKFENLFFRLFERSLRKKQLESYQSINQVQKYQLSQLGLSSFATTGLEEFKRLLRKNFIHLLFQKVSLYKKVNDFQVVDLCKIEFSKTNQQYIYYQAVKKIEGESQNGKRR